MLAVPAIDAELGRVKTALARLEGRRQEMLRTYQQTSDTVGAARGRIKARSVLDGVMKDIQKEVNDRTVGSYAKMLTALAQDVMDRPIEVGLDLTMERGLPSLDIFLKRGDRQSDILENCGGSITNIICFGLRAIATKRSGMRQFLALDEPDCWLEPDKVGGFFRVIEMAAQSDMQIVVVTHHRLSSIGVESNLIELTGRPTDVDGLRVNRRPGAREWGSDDEPGLRSIRLVGHSSFADATIPLSPGLNVIMGENDIGKSRIIRALRGVAYGESDDSDIRDGGSFAEVHIAMEGKRVLSWSRRPKRNPVTLWRLADETGETVTRAGIRCETGGRQVPDWLKDTLGIVRYDGLDIQLAHQKIPVFLLDKPGSQRAMVLSVGGEAGMLRDMVALSREDRVSDTHIVRDGTVELEAALDALQALDIIDKLQYQVQGADDVRSGLTDKMAILTSGKDILERFRKADTGREMASRLSLASAELPSQPDIMEDMDRLRRAIDIIRDVGELEAGLAGKARIRVLTSVLPEATPALEPTDEARDLSHHFLTAKGALERAQRQLASTSALPQATPVLPSTDEARALTHRLLTTASGLERAQRQLGALVGLPKDVPALSRTDEMVTGAQRLVRVEAAYAEASAERVRATKGQLVAAVRISDILAEIGNICPLCGTGGIDGDKILSSGFHHHDHNSQPREAQP